jgi:hypothetical protein
MATKKGVQTMITSISPKATAKLHQALNMQDKNKDGVIENGVDEGYIQEADINLDGSLVGAEIRFHVQQLGLANARVLKLNPVTPEDKINLQSILWERIRDTDFDSIIAEYGLAAMLNIYTELAMKLDMVGENPEYVSGMFQNAFGLMSATMNPESNFPPQDPQQMIDIANTVMERVAKAEVFGAPDLIIAMQIQNEVTAYYQSQLSGVNPF